MSIRKLLVRSLYAPPLALAGGLLALNPVYAQDADDEETGFSTGLQLDLVYNQIINHVAFAAGRPEDIFQVPGAGAHTSRGLRPASY